MIYMVRPVFSKCRQWDMDCVEPYFCLLDEDDQTVTGDELRSCIRSDALMLISSFSNCRIRLEVDVPYGPQNQELVHLQFSS